MSSKPNVLVLPAPGQGHINPFLSLSYKLVDQGFRVTFVNTEFNHKRIVSSQAADQNTGSPSDSAEAVAAIQFVSIPDGLAADDDRSNSANLCWSMLRNAPASLGKLIQDMACLDENNRIKCIIVDFFMAWALEVGSKMGIKTAAFCPASGATFHVTRIIPKLLDDGIIDCDGFPIENTFQLSPSFPKMNTDLFFWSNIGDSKRQKDLFHYMMHIFHNSNLTNWWLCNTASELESTTLSYIPKVLPIGPLLKSYHTKQSLGQFWEEDLSSLHWLDQQPHCSVIYVAFGSIATFKLKQFEELALGLDLTNRPFLWVVRPNINGNTDSLYPNEFSGKNGKIIKWAPQQKVLSHPAIACFISHCGWNSTLEGVCNGVPFLCWPYFADQFVNMSCICNEWKVGLGFDSDEEGIVSRWEIKKKVEQLVGDGDIRASSLKLNEVVMNSIAEGGQSSENINKFVKWVKE